ncbi:MAG: hypothetical protein ACYCSN_03950 [Acidobacteriaceae bacterium]
MTKLSDTHPDGDIRKGATEEDAPATTTTRREGHVSTAGQLGHRDQDAMMKDHDTDFPEPDASGEHSGSRTNHK